jgi:polysaccharide export outer membrane protein
MFSQKLVLIAALGLLAVPAAAQQPAPAADRPSTAAAVSSAATLPAGYVIGPEDVLSIVFWRDKEMSGDVVVRPDGKISLPLLNDVQAAGLTPDQLRDALIAAASKYVEEPNAAVVVKEIHSRNVFITGNVAKPGTYPLTAQMDVLKLIALAGGLQEYADTKHIVVIRTDAGKREYHKFNYNDVIRQKHVQQNIVLKPGDTVIVP